MEESKSVVLSLNGVKISVTVTKPAEEPMFTSFSKEELLLLFGQNLEKYRKQKGLSKRQFCKETGISLQNYYRYIAGKHEMGIATARKIAVLLGIRLDDLFAGYLTCG